MAKNKKTVPPEYFEYASRLNELDDEGFAEAVLNAECVIVAFLDSVSRNTLEMPSREELAKATICLAFSTRQEDVVKGTWDVVWRLSNDGEGICSGSINLDTKIGGILATQEVFKHAEATSYFYS